MGAPQQALLMVGGTTGGGGYTPLASYEQLLGTGSTTHVCAVGAVSSGVHVFAFVRYEGGGAATAAVTDNKSNTYTACTRAHNDTDCYGQWFYSLAVTGDSNLTLTVTYSTTVSYRYIGVIIAPGAGMAYDADYRTENVAASSITVGPFNTPAAGLLLVGRAAYNTHAFISWSAGLIQTPAVPTSIYGRMAYEVTSAAQVSRSVTYTGNATPAMSMSVLSMI
jgi:hypothetical protein